LRHRLQRTPDARPEQELTEPEARDLAGAASPWPIGACVAYRWGWVFHVYDRAGPLPPGPGAISVTLRGRLVMHGSVHEPFSDDEEPVDLFAPQPSWWRRLLGRPGA
jgi:hypothetical protein